MNTTLHIKKSILLILVLLALATSLSAQITQEQADEIAIERLVSEIGFTLYAKDDVQPEGFTVATATGETIELDYACWVYFAKYTGKTNHKYLIVKENNGNLLEVNTKNDEGVNDIEDWRKLLPIEVPFTEYSLEGTSCKWKQFQGKPDEYELIAINSNEELESYICEQNSWGECIALCTYLAIDFSKYTLLLARGYTSSGKANCYSLQQVSKQNYEMKVNILFNQLPALRYWHVPIIVNKLSDESVIELVVTF